MKKILALLLCVVTVLSFAACDVTELIQSPEQKKASFEAMRSSMDGQNAVALDAELHMEDNGTRMLVADVKNNTTFELTDVKIAFAAFSASNQPIALDFENGESYYVVETDMRGLTIAPSQRWYADMGLELDNALVSTPDYVEAIVMSYKANGTLWENPEYDKWCKYFNGVAIESYMRRPEPTEAELKAEYDTLKTEIVKQSAVAFASGLYPQADGSIMLVSDVKNNTAFTLSDVKIAFAGWDANGKPVKLKGQTDILGYYVQEISMTGLTVDAGAYWTGDMGFALASECSVIERVEAIVMSCKINGEDWQNPYYGQWQNTFMGEELTEYKEVISAGTGDAQTEAVA